MTSLSVMSGVVDLGVRPGVPDRARHDEDAVAGVVADLVLGEGGVGNEGAWHVAGAHIRCRQSWMSATILFFTCVCSTVPAVVKSPARMRMPTGKCCTCKPVMVL